MQLRKSFLVFALALIGGFGFWSQASASFDQLTVVNNNNAANLVSNILAGGPTGVVVSNETLTGDGLCAGDFTGGLNVDGGVDFAIDTGIVLSTGQATSANPPNVSDSTTTAFGTAGDPQLDVIVAPFNTTTNDACVLEFDFVCPAGSQGSLVTFNYIFTSEEYNEFTNSAFTNVFAWFLNGTNIALLPDNVTPVQINTVNGGNPAECVDGLDNDGDGPIDLADSDCTAVLDDIVGENNSNSSFYNNNDCSDPDGGAPCPDGIEADGYTDRLTVKGAAIVGVNNMKLAIADAGDSILDSWAFIEEGSFQCTPVVKTDVKPGSNPNCVNPDSRGVISVAYFGSELFDVTTINESTLEWGEADPLRCKSEDSDGDGITDLVCKYRTSEVALPVAGDDCKLVEGGGMFLDGTVFIASDLICVPGDPVCNRGDPI